MIVENNWPACFDERWPIYWLREVAEEDMRNKCMDARIVKINLPVLGDRPRCAVQKSAMKPRSVEKIERERHRKAQELRTRKKINARDQHRCFFPGCRERAFHKHHKTYRSRGGKWETENIVSGCARHHRWVHDKLIRLIGNPDKPPMKIELTALGLAAKIRLPKEAA